MNEDLLNESREEYRLYKSKAHSLLKEKSIETSQTRIQTLESQVEILSREKQYFSF